MRKPPTLVAALLLLSLVTFPLPVGAGDFLVALLTICQRLPTGEVDGALGVLKRRYRNYTRHGLPQVDLRRDAQRLINPNDWRTAKAQMPLRPWEFYGKQTLADWRSALDFTRADAGGMPLSNALLQAIHSRASRNLFFTGYEERRIEEDYRAKRIPREVRDRRMRSLASGGKVAFSGTLHSNLAGKFRSQDIDHFIHRGDRPLADGTPYMTKWELEQIRANPYYQVNEATIREVAPGKFVGEVHCVRPQEIERTVAKVLEQADRELKAAKTDLQIVEIVVKLQKDLITIHPFHDGNGRTIRLLGDLILQRHGLPPQYYPNEHDFFMTQPQLVAFALRGMESYVDALGP